MRVCGVDYRSMRPEEYEEEKRKLRQPRPDELMMVKMNSRRAMTSANQRQQPQSDDESLFDFRHDEQIEENEMSEPNLECEEELDKEILPDPCPQFDTYFSECLCFEGRCYWQKFGCKDQFMPVIGCGTAAALMRLCNMDYENINDKLPYFR